MNPSNPIFRYYISGIASPLTKESHLWNTHLLGKKEDGAVLIHEYFELAEQFIKSNNYKVLKIGIEFALKREEFKFIFTKKEVNNTLLQNEISINAFNKSVLQNDADNEDNILDAITLNSIDIFLEKHGAFYHPAKVEAVIEIDSISKDSIKKNNELNPFSCSLLFVLNTAVSPQGNYLIHYEYNILKYLSKFDKNYVLPKVFGIQTMEIREIQVSFFLGTWFDEYKEFHVTESISRNDKDILSNNSISNINNSINNNKKNISNINSADINIWNSDGTVITISPPRCFQIYEKASEILTNFYDINSFKQISDWHHAAGDFIVKQTQSGFDVKLITVRNYSPIVEPDYNSVGDAASDLSNSEPIPLISSDSSLSLEDKYKALLLFFLNLTLKMRIDRIDGTGGYCLVDGDVIKYILKGFFKALKEKTTPLDNTSYIAFDDPNYPNYRESFFNGFKSYLCQFSQENLYQIFLIIIEDDDLYNLNSKSEIELIRDSLKEHSELIAYFLEQSVN